MAGSTRLAARATATGGDYSPSQYRAERAQPTGINERVSLTLTRYSPAQTRVAWTWLISTESNGRLAQRAL